MLSGIRIALICSTLIAVFACPADARRVALVVGNAAYKIGPLQNPVNDATAVAEAFETQLKFDKVILKRNLDAAAFRAALLELSRESSGADLGIVYFAGHGTEVNGKNFLIPIDARLARAGDLSLEAIPLDSVLDQLAGVAKLKLIILDACRNNLFALAGSTRSVSRGLSRIEPEDNTLVAYAAKDGTTADDGAGRKHSPFTEALLRHIATPGLEVNLIFRRVRDDVIKATGHAQQPHVYASLGGQEIHLQPPAALAPPIAKPAPAALPQPSEVERAWAAIKDTTSIAALETFRRQYGPSNAVYGSLAEARIEELRRQQVALAVPPDVPKAATTARGSAFIPTLAYRTGPYKTIGIPYADGFADYYMLLNERDAGIEGVKIIHEECETGYDTRRGVECYERFRVRNALMINPISTGITYALIPKTPADQIPILSMGYGRTDAAVGNVHPWVFVTPASHWSQASAKIMYIASREGGVHKLRGKRIAYIYHNSPYGKEAIPVIDTLARKYGYVAEHLPVEHPGVEQKAAWLRVARSRPDWVLFRGWGVMNPIGINEAAAIDFRRDRMIGTWWSGAEVDVMPVGDAAKGYIAATFHAPGNSFKVHEDLKRYVYARGKGATTWDKVGEVLYNRGLVNAMVTSEAVRNAIRKHGAQVTGARVREGMERLDLTATRLDELGFGQMLRPIKVSCNDHEGSGRVLFQQWDGRRWNLVSDWIEPMHDVMRPLLEASARKFAEDHKLTPRRCP